MTVMKNLFLTLLVSLFVIGCGSSKSTVERTIDAAPDWYTNVPTSDDMLYAAVTSTSQDMQIAVNKAQADARNQISQQMEVKYSALTQRFQEEVGLAADSELLEQYTSSYKAVVSQVLNGSRATDQEIIPEGESGYRAFVLMEMPIGQASQQLLEQIRQNQLMYTRFRASQAYEELESEVEKYEQWKKDNGQ